MDTHWKIYGHTQKKKKKKFATVVRFFFTAGKGREVLLFLT